VNTPSKSSTKPILSQCHRLSPYAERILDTRLLADMSVRPLPNILRFHSQSEPLRLHPSCVAHFREHLHGQRKRMDDPVLETFVQRVFANDLMVEAYFQLREINAPSLPLHRRGLEQLPFEAALRAAREASSMDILKQPHEKQLAYAAALIYSCGLFHCLHPWVVKDTGISDVDFGRADGVRGHLLEWNLHQMRMDNAAMGDTLGEVLGQGLNDDCDPEQVRRIGNAVRLANRRITELWTA
jgi:hypothetical protein